MVRPARKVVTPAARPFSAQKDDAEMRKIERALAIFGVIMTLVSGALVARESWGYGKYHVQRGYQASTCIVDGVHGEGADGVVTVHTKDPRRPLHGTATERDTSMPTPGFGGSEPEPPTFTRFVGAEVPCFYDPARADEIVLRRWTAYALWPLILLVAWFAGSFLATRWMLRRLRG
jgi:hypothetical protein